MNINTDRTAVIYVRISDDRRGLEEGIARQEEACRAHAAAHGYTVANVYRDNDKSAMSRKPRPDFERLLVAAKAGEIGAIIVWATDRFYRRLTDLERIVSALDSHSVPVLAVKSGDIDLSTADGRLHARLLGAVAQHESEKKAERVTARAQQRVGNGVSTTGRRPFGWMWRNPDGVGGDLTPHPDEGPAVEGAYERFLNGETLSGIARWLNESGFAGTTGGSFTQARVSHMLRLPRHGAW